MDPNIVREILPHELAKMRNEGLAFQLIDVREADELDICNLGGHHIPLGQIDVRKAEIATDRPVIIHCKSGMRGNMAVLFLQQNHGFSNLYNLKDGIIGYSQLDSTLTVY